MKKMLSLLAITLFTTQSEATGILLNLDEFQKTFDALSQAQSYQGEINSEALTGKAYEKFIVTGSSDSDKREPVLMTGYSINPTKIGTLYSMTQYRVYCDDETYSFTQSNFEPNGVLSSSNKDTDYAFEYESPSARDQQFTQILKNTCQHSAQPS